MALKDWKKSQTNSGFYKKYNYGIKYIKFKYEPKNKFAGKWGVFYSNSGSGSGHLIKRAKTKTQALAYAKSYMRKH